MRLLILIKCEVRIRSCVLSGRELVVGDGKDVLGGEDVYCQVSGN